MELEYGLCRSEIARGVDVEERVDVLVRPGRLGSAMKVGPFPYAPQALDLEGVAQILLQMDRPKTNRMVNART
jgi:hypothetical protein